MGVREPQELLDSLSGMTRSLRAAAAQTYAAFEVGATQAKFLRHLGAEGRLSQADVARATGSDPTLTGRVLKTLIDRGWVRRTRSQDDRRQYVLELSPAGQRARKKVEAARRQVAARMAAALDERDLADFTRVAGKIRAAFRTAASGVTAQAAHGHGPERDRRTPRRTSERPVWGAGALQHHPSSSTRRRRAATRRRRRRGASLPAATCRNARADGRTAAMTMFRA